DQSKRSEVRDVGQRLPLQTCFFLRKILFLCPDCLPDYIYSNHNKSVYYKYTIVYISNIYFPVRISTYLLPSRHPHHTPLTPKGGLRAAQSNNACGRDPFRESKGERGEVHGTYRSAP